MGSLPIRVLLCESSVAHHEGLTSGFSQALLSVGYRASIEICQNIDAALSQLEAGGFEILVTDLSFGKDLAVGFDFARKAKLSHPDLCIIACSSGTPTLEMIRNKQPSFDVFVPKRVILNPAPGEIERIGEEIHENIEKLIGFKLFVAGADIDSLRVSGEPISEREIYSLVSQVLSDLKSTEHPFRPTEVTFTPVTGGYSGSLVGLLSLRGVNASLKYVKTVVKISLAQWAKDEVSNFKRYAKWMLPFNKRVELVGEGQTSRFGAVAYAFVFGGEEDFFNLTTLIAKENADELMEYVRVIFDNELLNFYNSTRIDSKVNIGQHYRARYFPDSRIEETMTAFKDIILRHFGAKEQAAGWLIEDVVYPEPFRVIFAGPAKKFSLSICHGDLNSDNIICASPTRVAYIDFQDTGPGHLLQDFAALESSIRLNWGGQAETLKKTRPSSLLKREWAIARNSARAGSSPHYDKLCVALRALAKDKFPTTDAWEYPYAIGALSLKLMRVRGLSEVQLCRLAACALVATSQLQGMKGSLHLSGV